MRTFLTLPTYTLKTSALEQQTLPPTPDSFCANLHLEIITTKWISIQRLLHLSVNSSSFTNTKIFM